MEYLGGEASTREQDTYERLASTASNALTLFNHLDTDADGFLSARELQRPLDTRHLQAAEFESLILLRAAYDKLKQRVDDGPQGVSRSDVESLVDALRDTKPPAAELVAGLFTRADRDRDGFVSPDELAQAGEFTASAFIKQIIVHLAERYEWAHQFNRDAKAPGLDSSAFDLCVGDLVISNRNAYGFGAYANDTLARDVLGNSYPLYKANGLPIVARISSDACVMAEAAGGNCSFVGALQSLASVNPAAIQRMIRDNGNLTYTVTFPGAPDKPVTVLAPTHAELKSSGLFPYKEFGIWPYILQKAYGRYYDPEALSDYSGGADGSGTHAGIRLLTSGRSMTSLNPLTSYQRMSANLNQALRDGLPVTTAVGSPAHKRNYDFARNHCYAVINFKENPEDLKASIITLQNPWGHERAAVNEQRLGKFNLTLEEFNHEFEYLNYSEKRPARTSLYNWVPVRDAVTIPFLEGPALAALSAGAIGLASKFPRIAGLPAAALFARETYLDGRIVGSSAESSERLKYSASTFADAAIFSGFLANALYRTRSKTGLAIAGAGILARYVIEQAF
jgi:hypothetical protein